jgi:MarR family 2-MHQ and catechol resistance regulon transcriptional repressor
LKRQEESLKAFVGIKRTNEFLEQVVKKDVKSYGLNITEFAVLELLYNKGEQPIQKVKERILIASSSTTYVIDKLCEKGFVKRRQDTVDKRISFASLTDKGENLMAEAFPLHAEKIEETFNALDDTELKLLRTALKKISAQKL